MLDRTNIHFKKAVEAVLEKVKIHKGNVTLSLGTDYLNICIFKDGEIFYHDMICEFHSKKEILQKVYNLNKSYYVYRQLQKKGGRHE